MTPTLPPARHAFQLPPRDAPATSTSRLTLVQMPNKPGRRDTAPGCSGKQGSPAAPVQPSSMVSQAKGCALATRGHVSRPGVEPARESKSAQLPRCERDAVCYSGGSLGSRVDRLHSNAGDVGTATRCVVEAGGRDSRERPATLPTSRATRQRSKTNAPAPLTGVSGVGDQVEPGDSSASRATVNHCKQLVAEAQALIIASRALLQAGWRDVVAMRRELRERPTI